MRSLVQVQLGPQTPKWPLTRFDVESGAIAVSAWASFGEVQSGRVASYKVCLDKGKRRVGSVESHLNRTGKHGKTLTQDEGPCTRRPSAFVQHRPGRCCVPLLRRRTAIAAPAWVLPPALWSASTGDSSGPRNAASFSALRIRSGRTTSPSKRGRHRVSTRTIHSAHSWPLVS